MTGLRHDASKRNVRKALRQARRILGELLSLHNKALKNMVNFEYAISKATKLINRLKSEYKLRKR